MKREKEDDGNTQTPTTQSTQVDHFANSTRGIETTCRNIRIQPDMKKKDAQQKP